MAHTIARWTARIGLGEQVVTTKTLRRRFFSLAGRITRSARRLTLHLPQRWPWEAQFDRALARLRALPLLPDGGGGNPARIRPTERPRELAPVRSASASCCVLSSLSRPDQHSQTVTKSPRGQLKTDTGPLYPKSCPDHRPPFPYRPFRCCIVIPSVDLG